MGKSNILQIGHPIYNNPAKIVEIVDENIFNIIKHMNDELDNTPKAVGLAANQIGFPVRIIALNYNQRKLFINPEIIYTEGKQITSEACGSIEGVWCELERPKIIKLYYYDYNLKCHIKEFSNIEAWIIAHEIDHLNTVFITDKAIKIHKCEIYNEFWK
jgi:peptide deformylase